MQAIDEAQATDGPLLARQRLTFTLALHAVIASLTGMLLGFDLCIAGAILTPVQRSLELCYPCGDGSDAALARCSCAEKQLAISAVSIGAAFGALVGGLVADRLGRRPALLASDVLFAGGGAAMALATQALPWLFFLGRASVGLALGLGGAASSAYLAEIAPTAWRGRFLEFNELCVCFGCLGAYGVAYGLGDARWRVSIGLTTLVAALQLLLILVALHESPHWLASRGLARRAERARAALATKSSSSAVSINPVGLPDTDERALLCGGGASAAGAPRGLRELGGALWAARRQLCLALGVATAHAATAANTVLYYSRDVLQLAGMPAGYKCRTPRLTTPPRRPACCLPGPSQPYRSLRIVEACRGLRPGCWTPPPPELLPSRGG